MEAPANSRRSTVYSTKGMVSSTQPLANSAGIKVMSMVATVLMHALRFQRVYVYWNRRPPVSGAIVLLCFIRIAIGEYMV